MYGQLLRDHHAKIIQDKFPSIESTNSQNLLSSESKDSKFVPSVQQRSFRLKDNKLIFKMAHFTAQKVSDVEGQTNSEVSIPEHTSPVKESDLATLDKASKTLKGKFRTNQRENPPHRKY